MPWAQGRSAACTPPERAGPALLSKHIPVRVASAWCLGSRDSTMLDQTMLPKTYSVHAALKKISVTNQLLDLFFIHLSNNSTQGEEAGGAQRWGDRLASEHVILNGWLEESAVPVWKTSLMLQFLSVGSDPSHSHPLSTISALPWAHQRTTSRHSACALAGWPPLGPCTLLSRRTSTLSCRGRWLLYSDQNLHKSKQNRTCQVSKNYHFCLLKLFEQNMPTSWWSALVFLCRRRPQTCVCWSQAYVECLALLNTPRKQA